MTPLNIGFIPLVDAAVLIAAHEKGFAAAEGLALTLKKERAWASVRDKLNLGHLDAAHLLAGMPVAASLGIGQVQVPTIAPFVMNMNGNAITLSNDLYKRMQDAGAGSDRDPAVSGRALKAVVSALDEPLTLAMVYPFSCHNYELRYWLASAGIDPDVDVRLVVIPPSLMAESLVAGQIDGFCAGEPWNSFAIDMGVATVVLTKADLWRWGPEKVLGLRADWARDNADTVSALVRALYHSAVWCDAPENHAELATILSRADYVGAPAETIARGLSGDLLLQAGGRVQTIDNFLVMHKQAANFPWRSQALWLYSQMVRWGQVSYSSAGEQVARDSFRPDLYRKAVAALDPAPILPSASAKVEGALDIATPAGASGPPLLLGPDNFFDDRPFDPDDIKSYLEGFSEG